MSKIALGTVQFGLEYGINNKSGLPSDANLSSILKLAKESGIEILDTAQVYGNAEERIGKLSNNEFRIVTKFKRMESSHSFKTQLYESLSRLNIGCVYGYMAHDGDSLIQNPSFWMDLLEAKSRGLVEKVGYSLYSTSQLESLLDKGCIPDIIQFPYNVLDRRFELYLPVLVNLGVEIHTRSVYLQGLLQMNERIIPKRLEALRPSIIKIRGISDRFGLSIGELCIGFVLNNSSIDKVVVGVDNELQLVENVKFSNNAELSTELMSELDTLLVSDMNLLDPSNWK